MDTKVNTSDILRYFLTSVDLLLVSVYNSGT